MNQQSNQENIMEVEVETRMKKFEVLLEKAKFSMKQYQHDGIEWCLRNELSGNKIKGGIIADEMGLGKTLTMIGLMFVNFKKRTLIIVPPVLLDQWAKEIYRCLGHRVLKYHGNQKKTITEAELRAAPIVLTTYNMLLLSKSKSKSKGTSKTEKSETEKGKTTEDDVSLLTKIKWSRLIFDEAHHLRNKRTERFTSCKNVKAQIRWLVSGTPVQNKRQDFYNLCNIIGIDKIGKDKIGKDDIPEIVDKYILRRTKADVGIQLPPVLKEDRVIPWKNQYEKMMSEEIHSLLPNQTGVKNTQDMAKDLAEQFEEQGALIAILRARQSCIMPALMTTQIHRMISDGIIENPQLYINALQSNSKLDAIISLIVERKDNGNGKLIFCHFRDEIDTIARRLQEGGLRNVVTYDGRNSNTVNGQKILTEAADAIILQIQTGCEGLNLQEHYSEIYFVSPHWNPCVEDQAVARCHRIGQKKPTYVFKFEMSGFEIRQQDPEQRVQKENEKQNPEQKENEDDLIQDPITLEKYVNNVQNIKRQIINQIITSA
jgi:SNF2 family DNA or RNA helicase